MSFVSLNMNAGRICDGLSRIGYTPPAAITDIIDNAVTHHAKQVWVQIVPEKHVSKTRKDNVKAYLIIDDGDGMDEAALLNALSLGSSADDYGPDSLSKFGLGLKSASFSQGETLEVVSSDGDAPFLKYRVSLPQVRAQDQYGAEPMPLTDEDQQLIDLHLPDGRGTIVRITDVRKGNHPSIAATMEELQQRAGIIYYYFMADDALEIYIDGKKCEPFDVLCTAEADTNGNLNEHDWNGREVRWIEKKTEIVLDGEKNISAQVEVTQLPHPPTFHADKPVSQQVATRDKYRIGAGNYGFYVYRNKRLLSWAERFGIIPLEFELYAYRGRIQINSDADDALNIDVKKSQIHLSGEAYTALRDFAEESRRKSKNAWLYRASENKKLLNQDATGIANRLAEQINFPEELPGAPDSEEAYADRQEREREIVEEQEQRFEQEAAQISDEIGEAEAGETDEATREERKREAAQLAIRGQDAGPIDRIFLVNNVEDHALWEPYYDPDKKNCVRINELHRFARTIYDDNAGNGDLKIFFNLILLQLSASETYVEKNMEQFKREDISVILGEFRRVASELLAKMAREQGDELPRNEN